MNVDLFLGGFKVDPNSQKIQFPVISNPTVEDISNYLEQIVSSIGFLTLWKGDEDEPGECSLNMYSENNLFYFECITINPVGEEIIYRLHDNTKSKQQVNILGQKYSKQLTCSSFSETLNMFSAFLATRGEIPIGFSNES